MRGLRHGAEAVAVGLAWGLFALLPLDGASAVGGWLGRALGPRLKVSRRARNNLRRTFPEHDAAAIEAILNDVWDNLGRMVAEFPHQRQLVAERVEIVGGEYLAGLRDDGRPGFLVSAHFGGWELSGPLASRLGLPVHVVYRAANNPWVDKVMRWGRGTAVAGLIPKGGEGARTLLGVLKAGGHIAMLVDQKMNDGIAVPFLGREAMTAPAVARLARAFDCPIVVGRVERLEGARFRAVLEPPLVLPDSGDRERDTYAVMARINAIIEGWVRAKPGQWLWLHRRWPD